MIDYYAVVVLYNTFVNDSVTINNLRKIMSHQIHIVVLDNSTQDLNNGMTVMKNGWSYLSMHGNAGLSKAYNRAIEYLINEDGIVIWFDDDAHRVYGYKHRVLGSFFNSVRFRYYRGNYAARQQ